MLLHYSVTCISMDQIDFGIKRQNQNRPTDLKFADESNDGRK